MQTTDKLILGSGIAGLLKAYFNQDAIIVTEQMGGQFSSKFQLGPRYLHVDEYTKRFFEEINTQPKIKKIKIGFYFNGVLHSKNTEENRKKYFKKTRGESNVLYTSVMSSNKTEFDSFDVELNGIVEILKNKINNKIILEKILKIDLLKKEIQTDRNKIKYNKLISTIPLNTFLFLSEKPEIAVKFKSYPTTFVLTNSFEHCPFKDFSDFDYVYISEPEYDFHRITNSPFGLVFEYRGDAIKKTNLEIDRVVMKVGQLIQNNIKIEFDDVEFFGRYATWEHNVKINELLKQLYEFKKNI